MKELFWEKYFQSAEDLVTSDFQVPGQGAFKVEVWIGKSKYDSVDEDSANKEVKK